MRMDVYGVKRLVLRPVVWQRRRGAADESPGARALLEQYGYTKPARLLMAVKAIDPDVIHRVALDASSVTFDVGAYLGDGAAAIRRLYGGRVYAFEPNPNIFPRLEARFAGDPEVVTLPYALGPQNATLSLALAGPGSSVLGRTRHDDVVTEVAVRDIVEVMDELGLERVDLMKINIEGAEYDLLDRLIEAGALERVRYLLVQFHEWHASANVRRWRLRRRFRRTHDVVWDYPWIWELWCAKAMPHPVPAEIDEATQRAVVEELRQRRARSSAAG